MRSWAVEMGAENGKMVKWEEVTSKEKDIDRSKLW